MAINKLDLLALSHMITLIFAYIYHVTDKSFFHLLLLLFLHSTWSYCVVRISKLLDLKAFMYHLCCIMVMLLTTCISYVNHLKSFVDPKPGDPNPCTSPRVSCVKEMRSNALPNDLSTREKALKSNMDPSSSSTHTLEQGGQYDNINILTSLGPPYSPKTYLQHQSLCREDDVMHFIHDLSPRIEITKNELLHDEDVLLQSSKKDKIDKGKEILIPHDIPPSSTNPFLPPYTSDLKEIHDHVPPSSQLQHSYSHGFHIITKQGFKGQGIGKFEH